MSNQDFNTTILVDRSKKEVFNGVTNPKGWWSEEIEGHTEQLNDEFTYHYEDAHFSKIKLIEVLPVRKVVWLVMDNYFSFTKNKSEWKGTKIIFEISEKGGQTQLRFTHQGLVPEYECYDVCKKGWTQCVQQSLFSLISKGKGQPNPKESSNGFNAQLAEKRNLMN